MRRLKTIFACLLMAVLSIGQVWADAASIELCTSWSQTFAYATSYTHDYTINDLNEGTTTMTLGVLGVYRQSSAETYFQMNKKSGYFKNTTALPGKITKIETIWSATKGATKCYFANGAEATSNDATVTVSAGTSVTYTPDNAADYYYFNIDVSTGSGSAQMTSCVVYYETADGETKTLSSVAVSGDPTKTDYHAGQEFDPAGLTVTGTYSDESTAPITSGITWTYSPSQTLALNQTSIGVIATVNNIASAEYNVTGLTVTEAPAAEMFEKVTAAPEDWEGEYLIVYEADATTARVWTGVDAANGYVVAEIDASTIAKPEGAVSVSIAAMTGGYSVQVNGGDNDGKYLQNASSNGITFSASEVANTLTYENSAVTMTCGGKNFRYNSTFGQDRFRYFGSAQQVIQLYKKVGAAPEVKKPTITGDDNFLTSTTVTISHNDADAIYYTTDNSTPTDASTPYSAAFTLTNTATVKAIAVKGGVSSAVAEKTFTKATVLSVAEALAAATGNDKYVKGIIASIEEVSTEYGNATYNLKDEGQENSIKIYRGKNLNNENFNAVDQIIVGDEVTVFGEIKKYDNANQFAQGNYIVALKPAARLAWSDASYNAEIDGSNSFPTLANTNSVSVTYSSSNTDAATINASTGAIELVAEGTTTITATFAGNETYKANSVSYTLNVAAAVIRADISFNVDGGTAVEGLTQQSNLPNPLPTITKAGKNFGGWFTDAEFNTPAVAGAAMASTDAVTLYAKWLEPYTVAQARDAIDAGVGVTNVYATGIVSEIVTAYNSQYGNISYNISSDGTTTADQLQAFRGKAANGANFNSASDVQVGDVVVVYGNLTKHNDIYEFAADNQLYSFNRPEVAVTGVELAATATVKVDKTINLTASVLPANATNQEITWSVESGSDKITFDNGSVTGVAEGEAVIRATSAADNTKYAECTVTIVAADPVYAYYNYEKVTATSGIEDGEYLIVYEDGNVAFNGGLETLDAVNNTIVVEIEEGKIVSNTTTDAAAFTIDVTDGTILSASGKYIGVSEASNGLKQSETAYEGHVFSIEEGNASIKLENANWTDYMALRFNSASNQDRFRYYKNAGQQAIQLYKKVGTNEAPKANAELAWDPAEDMVLTVGDAFTAPTLNNPNSISASAITIASDNTDLAVVNDGVVSLVADATGTATITATFAGDENYKPAVVSYTITVNEAGLDNVTFDATVDIAGTGELSIVKSGFTLEFTSGAMDNGENYRLYKGQTMTLSSTAYYIKKIEFTCTSGNPISGFADAEGLDKANNQWTGQANSVELTASNAQVRIENLKVYYIEDTRAASGLAWSTDEVEITLGDEFTAANLVNPNSIDASAITIESDNIDLAVVNDGVVSLVADATGTAHISAIFAGNETYKPAEFSYTIKVNDPTPMIITNPTTYLNFGSKAQGATIDAKNLEVTLQNVAAATVAITGEGAAAFSADPMALTADGTITVSASSANVGTFNATLTISDNAGVADDKEISLSLTVTEPVVEETAVSTTSKWVAATAADLVDGKEVLIVGVNSTTNKVYAAGEQSSNNRAAVEASVDGEGVLTPGANTMSFTLVAQDGGTFALRASNGNYLYAASSSKNYLRSQATIDDNAKWTLTATSASAEASSNNHVMQFNSGSTLFSCYASASQSPIKLYVPQVVNPEPTPDYTRGGLEIGGFYTICMRENIIAASGVTFWQIIGKDNEKAYLETVDPALEAGMPYFFQATSTTMELYYGSENADAPKAGNGLVGTFMELNKGDLLNKYILMADNCLHLVLTTSGSVTLPANCAYVNREAIEGGAPTSQPVSGRRRVAMAMPRPEQTPTTLEAINAAELQNGQKLVINGHLYIVRDGRMFDATGRLVK